MLTLLISAALAGGCPKEPALRDPDGEVTALAQNLKFIITGEKRQERNELLAEWLREEGAHVDLLLLSEARLTGGFEAWEPEWCFYTQVTTERDTYRWAPIASGRPPAGLALGVRQRPEGEVRDVGTFAGRRYRASPTSFAEGVLGRIFHFQKGWAGIEIDDTHLVWSHTQASYRKHPENGAGEARRGRVGQFEDLAEDLGRPERATLLTGDLNLLAGFQPRDAADERRVERARAKDDETLAQFRERTGIDLAWPWAHKDEEQKDADPKKATTGAGSGTFAGGIDRRRTAGVWDAGASYDRVGVNEAFLASHPGTRVRRVEIVRDWMGVSDHLGLEISIPFGRRTVAVEPPPARVSTRRSCPLGRGVLSRVGYRALSRADVWTESDPTGG